MAGIARRDDKADHYWGGHRKCLVMYSTEHDTSQIYDPALVPPLVSTIAVLLGEASLRTTALISATVRNPATLDLFVDTCRTSASRLLGPLLDLFPDSRSIWPASGEARA